MATKEKNDLKPITTTTTSANDDVDNNNVAACDESKCVSKGRASSFGGSHTCYGEADGGSIFPMMCADGFLPVVIEGEPSTTMVGGTADPFDELELSYFTCCPPAPDGDTAPATNPIRRCSDPISTGEDFDFEDAKMVPGICDNHTTDSRIIPRIMKTSHSIKSSGLVWVPNNAHSIVCCDSPPTLTSYLDDQECVPYHSDSYERHQQQQYSHHETSSHHFALITAISCDFPDGSFGVSRPLAGQTPADVEATGLYRCCRSGAPLDPFIENGLFKLTIYVPLAVWSLAAAASLVVIIALLIPFFLRHPTNAAASKPRMFGSTYSRKAAGSRISRRRLGSAIARSMRSTIRSVRFSTHRSHRSLKRAPTYSTYNLYVVYLAFFDMVCSLIQSAFYWGIVRRKYVPDYFNTSVGPSMEIYIISFGMLNITILINVVIFYEIFILLQQSRNVRRIRQPSILRVNTQVGILFLANIFYMAVLYVLRYEMMKAGIHDETERIEGLSAAYQACFYFFFALPIAILLGIALVIWCGGFLPKTKSRSAVLDRAMKQLFFFFLRIVITFFVVWIPGMILLSYTMKTRESMYLLSLTCLFGFLPILSAGMVLTKFDSRKYIVDLISLAYCRSKKKAQPQTPVTQETQQESGRSGDGSVLPADSRNPDAAIAKLEGGKLDKSSKHKRSRRYTALAMDGSIVIVGDDDNDDDSDEDAITDRDAESSVGSDEKIDDDDDIITDRDDTHASGRKVMFDENDIFIDCVAESLTYSIFGHVDVDGSEDDEDYDDGGTVEDERSSSILFGAKTKAGGMFRSGKQRVSDMFYGTKENH